jgi:hypothetical protein
VKFVLETGSGVDRVAFLLLRNRIQAVLDGSFAIDGYCPDRQAVILVKESVCVDCHPERNLVSGMLMQAQALRY